MKFHSIPRSSSVNIPFLLKPGLANSSERSASFSVAPVQFIRILTVSLGFDCKSCRLRSDARMTRLIRSGSFLILSSWTPRPAIGWINNFRGVAEQAAAFIFELNIARQWHQATLRDVFLQSGDPRRRRAHRQQLLLPFFQSQVLQLLFRKDRLGVAKRGNGENFTFEISRRI